MPRSERRRRRRRRTYIVAGRRPRFHRSLTNESKDWEKAAQENEDVSVYAFV
jgi:hypothetical protein